MAAVNSKLMSTIKSFFDEIWSYINSYYNLFDD